MNCLGVWGHTYRVAEYASVPKALCGFISWAVLLDDETDIRDVMGGSDVKIQAFLDGWRRRHPACSLKAACGICRVDDDLTEAIDNANTARKTAKSAFPPTQCCMMMPCGNGLPHSMRRKAKPIVPCRKTGFVFISSPR